MLVLSRRKSERTIITTPSGERIVVEVVEVGKGNKVRLGFTAEKDVAIFREELIHDSENARQVGKAG